LPESDGNKAPTDYSTDPEQPPCTFGKAMRNERFQLAAVCLGMIFTIVALSEDTVGMRMWSETCCIDAYMLQLTFFNGIVTIGDSLNFCSNDDPVLKKVQSFCRGAGALCVLATLAFAAVFLTKMLLSLKVVKSSPRMTAHRTKVLTITASVTQVLGLISIFIATILMITTTVDLLGWDVDSETVPTSPILVAVAVAFVLLASWIDITVFIKSFFLE
jgi:hypothetical protein